MDESTREPDPQASAEQGQPSARYVNREQSWLQFNARVLEEALDPTTPLIERMRFLTIFYTNLDEFFMIRVSGLRQQIAARVDQLSIDGLSPNRQLAEIRRQVSRQVEQAQRCLAEQVLPAFSDAGVRVLRYRDLPAGAKQNVDRWFRNKVYPILTPLAVGPTHPFPFISNLSLNLGVLVRSPTGEERLARVKVPLKNLDRLVPLDPDGTTLDFVPLEDIIAAHLDQLFPGMAVSEPWAFRVTRDADFEIKEDEADDLLSTILEELRKRRFGDAVRLEVAAGMPSEIREALRAGLRLDPSAVTEVDGPLAVDTLTALLKADLPTARYHPFGPRRSHLLADDAFRTIRSRDVLLYHPFDSFQPVVDFLEAAANDPAVVAIKQTLYRTSGDSPVIGALEAAVENGKQVAAVVELKARFDEENNIVWAQRLEAAGVHVIYGVPGLKTHAKLCLVVRREGDELVRYAHIGTGNYNPTTARVYTDLGLITAHPDVTGDVADLFNRLTGFARPRSYATLLVAPYHLKQQLLELLQFETDEATAGRPARAVVKCNSLTDKAVVDALYAASQAGVQVDLLVRGICCLVPGVPGVSDRITVRSAVGRFLEHARVFWFHHAGHELTYIGSADWMERNLDRRVEVLTPVLDPGHAKWLRTVMLERYLQDVGRTRVMQMDGSYLRLRDESEAGVDVHEQFMRDSG